MSCKLWSKVTSVFLNINLCAKMSILGKKIEFREKCWFFQTSVHYYWKWTSYWKTCLFSENCDFLCDCLYTSRNCRILIKTSIFLRKCLFVHVLIFNKVFYLWKIVILIQNMILFGDILEKLLFWFKIWFYSVIFWKKCHFPSKIYISGGIDILEKSSNFLRKGVNLAVNFGKNDNWY